MKMITPETREKLEHAAHITRKTCSYIGMGVMTIFLIGIITGCIVGTAMGIYVMKFVNPDDTINLRDRELNYTSVLYVKNEAGEDVELQRLHGTENRIWVDLEQVPQHLQDAFIAVEDERFETHHGVDWKRTIAATANLFLGFYDTQQGGSTITQQLVKNVTGEDDVRVERKVQEIFKALKLEQEYTKQDIMEAYLNEIHLGNNTNGVQAAANLYFGKDVSDLSIAESASIAAITQYPVMYNPFRYPENNKKRQEYVLQKMYEIGKITKEEYDQAMAEKLEFSMEGNTVSNGGEINSWFVDLVIDDVINDLMEQKGYTEDYATNLLYSGGYKIYTTEVPSVQSALEEVYAASDTFYKKPGDVQPESAMVVMDYNGAIAGIVGRRGEKMENRIFDLASDARRQPGSSIKPIASYGPAIENNLINWSTIFDDNPVRKIEGEDWPVNYYPGYYGNMTVVRALELSTNPVAVRVNELFGTRNSYNFLKDKLHFSVDENPDNGLIDGSLMEERDIDSPGALALGGLTNGVTLVEMAAAYQTFGNGGYYNKPHSYTKVVDNEGNTVLENVQSPERVFSEETASIMNLLLQDNAQKGTGRQSTFGSWKLAGKTGTSSDNWDHWYCGLSPYYVAVTWYGYEIPREVTYTDTGIHPSMRPWRLAMQKIHANLAQKDFTISPNIVAEKYCTESGLLATDNCSSTLTGYYKKDALPGTCTTHSGGGQTSSSASSEQSSSTVSQATEHPDPSSQASSSGTSSPVSSDTGLSKTSSPAA